MSSNKERQFVTVDELSVGFSEYSIKQYEAFAGRQIDIHYESGSKVSLHFVDSNVLRCVTSEDDSTTSVAAEYTLFHIKAEIYYLSFVWSYGDSHSHVSVLDLGRMIATTARGILPTREEVGISQFERGDRDLPLTSVQLTFEHGSIGVPFVPSTARHRTTPDLIGKRIQFSYSNNDVYEHVYLNERFYTWHCLKGVEKGLCDTERCHYYELDEGLYWFAWAERVVPTIGSVVEDLGLLRTYGTICGYKDYSMTRVTHFPVGSFAKILSHTGYAFS